VKTADKLSTTPASSVNVRFCEQHQIAVKPSREYSSHIAEINCDIRCDSRLKAVCAEGGRIRLLIAPGMGWRAGLLEQVRLLVEDASSMI
jgi:hypothetical protein